MTKKTASEKEINDSPEKGAEAKPDEKQEVKDTSLGKAEKKAGTKAKGRPKAKKAKAKPATKAKEAMAEPLKEAEQPAGPEEKTLAAAPAQEKKAKAKPKKKARGGAKKPAAPEAAGAEEKPQEAAAAPQAEAKPAPEEQAEALPEATAEPEAKPKGRRKKKKKPKTEAAPAAKETVPAAEVAEQPLAAPAKKPAKKKPGKKKPEVKKGERPGRETRVETGRVVVASQNPAKIKAVELGFARMFPGKEFVFEGTPAESGVSDQPMSDDETFAGALNRAASAREEQGEADYWVGLEGGLQEEGDDFFAFAWIVILGHEGLQGKSRTGTFVIPPAVSELVRAGKELGEADDIVFGQTNSKHSSGAIGILTHGILDRANYYAEAVLMALIPFKNPSLYSLEEVIEIEED